MTANEIEYIFKQLKQIDVLRISGGEPFVRKDLGEIINVIDQLNDPSLTHITTNGINTNRILYSLRNIENLSNLNEINQSDEIRIL